jgi:hypothetical protein
LVSTHTYTADEKDRSCCFDVARGEDRRMNTLTTFTATCTISSNKKKLMRLQVDKHQSCLSFHTGNPIFASLMRVSFNAKCCICIEEASGEESKSPSSSSTDDFKDLLEALKKVL